MSKSKFYLFLNKLLHLFRVEVSFYLFERRIATVSIPPKKKSAAITESELIDELLSGINFSETSSCSTPPADEL